MPKKRCTSQHSNLELENATTSPQMLKSQIRTRRVISKCRDYSNIGHRALVCKLSIVLPLSRRLSCEECS